MSIQRSPFGTTRDGTLAELFTISNRAGAVLKITSYGGRITELHVPDQSGRMGNVVLGFDNLAQYLDDRAYLGAIIGRFANRIARGRFELEGKQYQLPINDPPNSLHGGTVGFNAVVWKVEQIGDHALRFTHFSPDGDQGFPGNVNAGTTMTFDDDNALRMDFDATADAPTPVNMTHHCYFNLAGAGSGTVLDQMLTIHAAHYTPNDATRLPLGEIRAVKGTVFDFTTPTAIGARLDQTPNREGYDTNFVLANNGKLSLAAIAHDPRSGRTMETSTTQPGIQLYTAGLFDGKAQGIGGPLVPFSGFCLETQHFPDSPNRPNFPSTILRPGKTYRETVVYRFGIK